MNQPDDSARTPTSSDAEAQVDALAHRAGSAFRRPAPEDGIGAAKQQASRIRQRRTIIGSVGALALVAGGIAVTRGGDDSPQRVVVSPTSVTTTAVTTAPTTTAAPETTAAPTTAAVSVDTVVPGAAQADLDRWTLDYIRGTAGPVSGDPIKIAVSGLGASGAQRAAKYLNETLGGIGGRPVEIVPCTWGFTGDWEVTCGDEIAADSAVTFVLEGRYSTAFLERLRPDQITFGGRSGGTPLPGAGPTYVPSGASQLNAMAKFLRSRLSDAGDKRLVFVSDLTLADDFRRVLPEFDVIGLGEADFTPENLRSLDLLTASAVYVYGRSDSCGSFDESVAAFQAQPLVITNGCYDPAEGWYVPNLVGNPSEPSIDTGAAMVSARLGQVGDRFYGFLRTEAELEFSDVLTIARLYSDAGGPDATPDQLRAAMLGFAGDALLWGEQDCSLAGAGPLVAAGLPPQMSCAKFVDMWQSQGDGKYVLAERIDVSTP